jgi:hypothetical protein
VRLLKRLDNHTADNVKGLDHALHPSKTLLNAIDLAQALGYVTIWADHGRIVTRVILLTVSQLD